MGRQAKDKWQATQSPLEQDGAPARGPAAPIPAGRPPRGRLRKLGLAGLAAAVMISALALAPSGAQAATTGDSELLYVAQLTTTGTQPLTSVPATAPQGIAQVIIYPASDTIYTYLQFTNVGTGVWLSGSSPCSPGYIYPGSGTLYVMVAGKIATRALPPPTCDTFSDTWSAGPQIVQAIEANPGNAIVYVQAPPGQPGSREYLPGGIVLNPGSIWSRLQIAPAVAVNG
jgi:hypothetical protein